MLLLLLLQEDKLDLMWESPFSLPGLGPLSSAVLLLLDPDFHLVPPLLGGRFAAMPAAA